MNQQAATEVAILGGGCFWCLEAVYLEVRGVTRVESGYMGGASADPTYEQVCAGTTGHAEVVRLEFDPNVIAYRDILEIFFTIHDPTTLNRQGNDVGTQYRSVIFTTSPEQEATARKVMAEMAGVWDAPIVTQLLPEETWYKAAGLLRLRGRAQGGEVPQDLRRADEITPGRGHRVPTPAAPTLR
jgi:peptide-methionine (S)-S-oxide reductase